MNMRVLVTGADQHQGLAVIRGLGMAGVPVVAASGVRHNIGFASRYARATALYTSPLIDLERFISDILEIVERHRIEMILPAVESTLVALNRARERIEQVCLLAAPEAETLEWAIDKMKTVALAEEVGVPVPRTLYTEDLDEALSRAMTFRFPVVMKPRGHALHASTLNRLDYKVKYARTPDELELMLRRQWTTGSLPLLQEYAPGVGICVAALFEHGEPISLFPYLRTRELPLTGGVSVMRKSLPLDERLARYVVQMLHARRWHGVAMAEFKYDTEQERYTLMEINGRFQASTALSLDAGLNLPYMTYCVYAGLPLSGAHPKYRIGVRERWLRGDLQALLQHFRGQTAHEAVAEVRALLPSRSRALLNFLLDFRPGTHFDEFKWHDPRPGLVEALNWGWSPMSLLQALWRRMHRGRTVKREA